jgi:hypothetical protein
MDGTLPNGKAESGRIVAQAPATFYWRQEQAARRAISGPISPDQDNAILRKMRKLLDKMPFPNIS